ncbi:MAG TPA: metalloregulator ArsR/SmtB family transcription factor [Edaphobacter sp.]
MPDKRQAVLFQTLADPTRLAIFEHLSRGESTVTTLTKRFPISQPAVSQHLAVLRRCGLVAHRREGRSAIYQARPEGLAPLTDWITHYRTFWPERLANLKKLLAQQTKAQTEGDKA